MAEARLEILYEENPCLVVNKPPGVLTQAPPGIDSMEMRVRTYFGRPSPPAPLPKGEGVPSGDIYVGVPHRLDRPASGAMVFLREISGRRASSPNSSSGGW